MTAIYSTPTHSAQRDRLRSMLCGIFSTILGIDAATIADDLTFLELGAESMQLLQAGQAIQDTFGLKIPFRLLLEQLATIEALTDHLEQHLATQADPAPAPEAARPVQMEPATPAQTNGHNTGETSLAAPEAPRMLSLIQPELALPAHTNGHSAAETSLAAGGSSVMERIFTQQLQLMAAQIELLRGRRENHTSATPNTTISAQLAQRNGAAPHPASTNGAAATPATAASKSSQAEFVPYQPIQKGSRSGLTEPQRQHIAALTERLTARMRNSKQHTQDSRAALADNRVVTGFRQFWKELCFPLVIERGQAGRIWDIDGNEYVDLTMGFGALLFGHSPDFITEALKQEVALGMRLGPQSYLAGKVAGLLCELTGSERAAFCNSGTEAIMTGLRVARAITGRNRVALFAGSYHGTFDGTLVRGEEMPDGQLRAVPMAPGVLPNMVKDILLLRYNDPESLELLKAQAHELAAVLVEPPRSRRPDIRSAEFLGELRRITRESGTALIFDEIVTGFRTHPGGVQAIYDIQADLVTYGKAVAGGMPIGILAGKAQYLDAIDGGMWQYGDDSYPQADTTFFAGTFCKHPLSMAAAWAVLNHLKEQGPALQEQLTERTAQLVETLNAFFQAEQVPVQVVRFGSLFRFNYSPELRYMDMFFFHMLEYGVYIWEGRNCFLSTAHTEADTEQIITAVKASVAALRAGEFLPPAPTSAPPPASPPSGSISPDGSPAGGGSPARNGQHAAARHMPLSEAQKQLWFIAQMGEEASIAYHLPMALKLHGKLDWEALYGAVQAVVARHDALRTTFSAEGDYQEVAGELTLDLALTDITHLAAPAREEQAGAWLKEQARRPFDLQRGPLVRGAVLKLDGETHLLALTTHHLISDGQSLGTILAEIGELYGARAAGTRAQLAPATQFSAYTAWEAEQHGSGRMAEAETYWLERFAGPLPVLALPTDRPRPPVQSYAGTRCSVTFGSDLRGAIHQLSKRQNCTPFVTLLAGFFTLLHRLTGQREIVVGVPVAGQMAMGGQNLVGYCVNLLPLATHIRANDTVADYLPAVRRTLFDAYEHQIYPFNRLIKKLNPQREAGRAPLVSATFNLDHTAPVHSFGALRAELIPNPPHAAQFDITLNVVDTGHSFILECDYSTDLFDAATIERWLGHYATLLANMAAGSDRPLSELDLLTDAERDTLLVEWNATQAAYPDQRCFHTLFEEQATRTPEQTAAVYGDRSLTYRELNVRANRLANHLRGLGVGPETPVGLCMTRSLDLLVAMLGVLKAGGAYVPLDPTYPAERLRYMLEDARPAVLLTNQEPRTKNQEPTILDASSRFSVLGSGCPVVDLARDWPLIAEQPDTAPANTATPDNLAYVIYTSGSTGRPKGVQIAHRGLVNYLTWCLRAYPVAAGVGAPVHSSISFDLTITGMFAPLLAGRAVHLIPEDLSIESLATAFQQPADFSLVKLTPAHLELLSRQIAPRDAAGRSRAFVIGGENLLPSQIAFWQEAAPDTLLINEYGPTETVVGCCVYQVPAGRQFEGAVPIGRPIANTQLYVLDQQMRPVPIGVVGELYIGGAGVARGYLGRPDLTAERFVPNPFERLEIRDWRLSESGSLISNLQSLISSGTRLYKTGDLARYLPDGTLECLGRIDHQVKVRGFRIELGEIEAMLGQHPQVREAVVLAREGAPGEKRLVAYVVPNQEPRTKNQEPIGESIGSQFSVLGSGELRGFLKERLPEYMVPAAFVLLESFPLTTSGKVDRPALPEPDRAATGKQFVPPVTPIEKRLAAIWAQVLNLPQVGVDDNFFEVGGDSILSIQIIARANEAGMRLSPRHMFQYQTIAELAQVASANVATAPRAEQPLAGPAPLTPIQSWFFEQQFAEPHHFNLATLQEIREPIEPALLERALQHVIAHHDALRLRFTQADGAWSQADGGTDQPVALSRVDLSALPEAEQAAALEREAARLQASLDLRAGPIVRAALFQLGARRPDRLLIAVHHLAIDIFSWSVLLDDLQLVYRQLKRGERPQLAPRTTAYTQWARRLAEYAQSPALRAEMDYWVTHIPAQVVGLPLDAANGRAANTEASAQVVELSLSAEETQVLLQEAPKVYHAQVNEVLLTALAQALGRWTGEDKALIDLEGHGREPLFDDLNLTRTVGWFTAIYPALLNPGANANPGEALRAIKEQIRAIPHGGIGYGILRRLCADAQVAAHMRALPQADVCFNYLGQQDRSAGAPGLFAPASEGRGPDRATHGKRLYLLDVTGAVRNGQLTMAVGYSENAHHRATILQLAQDVIDALRAIIAHCTSPEAGGVIPSDFGLTKLNQRQLDGLLTKIKFTR